MDQEPDICKITALPMLNRQLTDKGLLYNVNFHGHTQEFRWCRNCYRKLYLQEHKDTILSFLLNHKVYTTGYELMHWDCRKPNDYYNVDLKGLVEMGIYPRTPKEKLENLFRDLFGYQQYDGQAINLDSYLNAIKAGQLYFKNTNELEYYLNALQEQGDISVPEMIAIGDSRLINFTFQGLNNYVRLFEEGYNSMTCFIAMNFDEDSLLLQVREAIKEAVKASGYIPILINEQFVGSDKTIPDEIILQLRKCKFCIADFTGNKSGVYFESGFAVGQGKPVIYTCYKPAFENVHFDIKQLQHILYDNPEELKSALAYKIKAWIQ